MNAQRILLLILLVSFVAYQPIAQDKTIKDLSFLIGTWEVREDNKENSWWETCTRIANFTLDSTYIEMRSNAISSSGKERTYLWLIHYNSKLEQFEMVSIFSNWHSIQLDILEWNADERVLTIRNATEAHITDYRERYGEIHFDSDFNAYTWTGQNKYGDPEDPEIWEYVEKGRRK